MIALSSSRLLQVSMIASTISILCFVILVIAGTAPLRERAIPSNQYFGISNFTFGCTTTCDWSFDVAIHGNNTNHPAVRELVSCSGSNETQDYVDCGHISGSQSIAAYINLQDQLQLQYEFNNVTSRHAFHNASTGYGNTTAQARFRYYGDTHVKPETIELAQPESFNVKESTAVACWYSAAV